MHYYQNQIQVWTNRIHFFIAKIWSMFHVPHENMMKVTWTDQLKDFHRTNKRMSIKQFSIIAEKKISIWKEASLSGLIPENYDENKHFKKIEKLYGFEFDKYLLVNHNNFSDINKFTNNRIKKSQQKSSWKFSSFSLFCCWLPHFVERHFHKFFYQV